MITAHGVGLQFFGNFILKTHESMEVGQGQSDDSWLQACSEWAGMSTKG